jgi:hypothetical protein
MAYGFDAYPIDRNTPGVWRVLYIGNWQVYLFIHVYLLCIEEPLITIESSD